MRANHLIVGVLMFGTACVPSTDSSSNNVEGEGGEYDTDQCKIEGSQIGQEGLTIRLGAKTVTVSDWVAKTGSANEYVGFSLGLQGGSTIAYVVKASGELYPSTSTTWLHPNGADGGSSSPAVSNVDFCGECENGGCDGGDNPPPCTDPDGCPDGGGGDPPCTDPNGCPDPTCDNPDGCPTPDPGTGPLL